ncbi:MAG: hypothetical protein JNN08_21020, partial [Bryobacterales bacterium]|nr:hypothetical protein [Bryobacterales bacterium]
WSAAVYSSFPADSTKILPKPVKGDKYTNYDKSHDAGTPEGALNFLIPGATGDGKKDYVGKASKKDDLKF